MNLADLQQVHSMDAAERSEGLGWNAAGGERRGCPLPLYILAQAALAAAWDSAWEERALAEVDEDANAALDRLQTSRGEGAAFEGRFQGPSGLGTASQHS
jgi:hypothetical protein